MRGSWFFVRRKKKTPHPAFGHLLPTAVGRRLLGGAFRDCGLNARDGVFAAGLRELVRNSQNLDAASAQKNCAFAVVFTHRRVIVSSAIQFDREMQSRAVEVEDVRPDWNLAAKLEARESSIAEPLPYARFHLRGSTPHVFGVRANDRTCVRHLAEGTSATFSPRAARGEGYLGEITLPSSRKSAAARRASARWSAAAVARAR